MAEAIESWFICMGGTASIRSNRSNVTLSGLSKLRTLIWASAFVGLRADLERLAFTIVSARARAQLQGFPDPAKNARHSSAVPAALRHGRSLLRTCLHITTASELLPTPVNIPIRYQEIRNRPSTVPAARMGATP